MNRATNPMWPQTLAEVEESIGGLVRVYADHVTSPSPTPLTLSGFFFESFACIIYLMAYSSGNAGVTNWVS